jgi:hypothetical protein
MANLLSTTLNGGTIEKSNSAGSQVSGTTVSIDISTANFFQLDLQSASGNIATFTIAGVKSGYVNSFVLKIITHLVSSNPDVFRQFNWASLSAFKWSGGSAPILTTTDNAVDILSFTTYDNGTTWYGNLVGVDFQ